MKYKAWLWLAAAGVWGAAHADYGITYIGTPGPCCSAYGVSEDGGVVVGYLWDEGRAFRWTQGGGVASLGVLNGGSKSGALGVSADGNVVVGETIYGAAGTVTRAFRWTQAEGMISLGALNFGTSSSARGVSADGKVVVGYAGDGFAANVPRAFRWTQASGMTSLGVLNGGAFSLAYGVSGDGNVVVGYADDRAANRAFRWSQAGGMTSLGALNGGTWSWAVGASTDGNVVVGHAADGAAANAVRAFRWSQAGGMTSLGVLNGGAWSIALGVSADGRVVVGFAEDVNTPFRAFRWTQATGMQTVEDWLRASGVNVRNDIASQAWATNSDGSVVVGDLASGRAFIARVIARGASGLVTLADVQQSLNAAATGGGMALSAIGTVLNGAHSRPLAHRVPVGQNAFWLAGDWGRDDHGNRNGDLGLAEVGLGRNFGPLQLSVALGQTWAKQDLALNGHAESDGTYLMAEALVPLRVDGSDAGPVATLGAYVQRGDAELRRGYLNVGVQDASTGRPDSATWGLRARLDWENAATFAGAGLTPYVDLTHAKTRLDAYTETGGGFPARFEGRREKTSELRLGVNASRPLTAELRAVGGLEAVHRFERSGARTVGEVIGLFGFDLAGPEFKRDWLRASAGVEGKLGGGTGALTLNATTRGEALNTWLAASWQVAF